MSTFIPDDITDEEHARQEALYGPFTQAVRDLVDVTIRTTVDDDEVRRAQAEIEAITARLRTSQIPGSYGVRLGPKQRGRPWGNAVVGLRNPIAPPLEVEQSSPESSVDGSIHCDFHLGAAYEGPPGCVHGGVLSLVLDQMLGQSAGAGGRPGMTATLTLTYRRPTPLGDLRAEARISRVEGHKTWATGHISGPEGITVEAEGLFILPRWARDAQARADAGFELPSVFE